MNKYYNTRYDKDLVYLRNYFQKIKRYGKAYLNAHMISRLKEPLFHDLYEAALNYEAAKNKLEEIKLKYELTEELNNGESK